MFKQNYIQKLAFDNIRRQRKFYRFIFVSLLTTFILSSVIAILYASYEEISYREKYTRYGKWGLVIDGESENELKSLKKDCSIISGRIYRVGEVNYQGKSLGEMTSLDNTALDLTALQLKEGRFPQNASEIILEEDRLIGLDIPHKVNQTIELTVNDGNHQQTLPYKIVGIAKNYSQIYSISLGSFITVNHPTSNYQTLVYSKDNLQLWNSVITNQFEDRIQYNMETYGGNYKRMGEDSLYQYDDYSLYFRYVIVIVGFIGVLGTMISSVSKRTENFVLMRAIGATSKQIQKLIVYEGLLLIIIAGIIGVVCGLILSATILYLYHSLMNGAFLMIVNQTFYVQLAISFIVAVIVNFIPSFEAYFIPLTSKVHQSIKKHKVRKIRKVTIPSLALRELTDNKTASISLIILLMVGIMGNMMLFYTIDTYTDDLKSLYVEDYDYTIGNYDDSISQDELTALSQIKGVSTQIVHSHDIQVYWQDITEEKSLLYGRQNNFNLQPESKYYYLETSELFYYENQAVVEDILLAHHMEGRFPENEDEVFIVKEFWNAHEDGSGSGGYYTKKQFDEDKKDSYIQEKGLDIGDEVEVFTNDWGSRKLGNGHRMKIVGTIYFDDVTQKENRLFFGIGSGGMYKFLTNKQTYQKYISKDTEQNIFCDVNNYDAQFTLKKQLFEIKNRYPDVMYNDLNSVQQLHIISLKEITFKDISFFGGLVFGIILLVYMNRKIKAIARKHQIGLYRAIGMTKKQIVMIYTLYAFAIYIISFIIYTILSILLSNLQFLNMLDYIQLSQVLSVISLGVIVIFVIVFAVYSELKNNILESISHD